MATAQMVPRLLAAMQAGVPIVPIVIHNATDVAPKNEFVMRPATVRVTVLPPVDASGWSARTMNNHVRDVRNMFLRTLGQPEESVAESVAKEPAAEAKGEKAPKKAATKNVAPKKKAAAKKAPARKAAAKKTVARKAPAKKAAKKVVRKAAKKAPARKAAKKAAKKK